MNTKETIIYLNSGLIVKCDLIHPLNGGSTKSVTVKNVTLTHPTLATVKYESFTIVKSHIVGFSSYTVNP